MKRKADPNRIIEARTTTRLGDVVRERQEQRQGKQARRREGDTPLYRAPRPAPTEQDNPFDEPQAAPSPRRRYRPDQEDHQDPENIAQEADQSQEPRKSKASKWTPMMRAVAMLARREHSQVEIIQKLMLKGVEEAEAHKVVAELVELDLQSDQRFLESKVRQRVNNGYGPRRTQMELTGHGLDETVLEQAVEEPGEQWIQGAYDLIERRYGTSPLPFELRQKALGLLVRRGFTFDQAQQVIRNPRPEPTHDLD